VKVFGVDVGGVAVGGVDAFGRPLWRPGWESEGNELANLERLDPETQAQMGRTVESARGLRGRPLVSGMLAKKMGDDAAKRQFAAMSGAPPEAQFAASQKGATLGGTILQQQGGKMVGEARQRFNVGLNAANAWAQLERGQAQSALMERLKRRADELGISLKGQASTWKGLGDVAALMTTILKSDPEDAPSEIRL